MKRLKIETIEKMLNDSDCDVREAAMNACQGKDVPLEIIERGLRDSNWHVRVAAMKINEECEYNLLVPPLRRVNPKGKVYKKCICDIIVVATIPNDAETRGEIDGKCRTNKAVIVDIIGDIHGEKVGISVYDRHTAYYIGDEINVTNFDYSDAVCSTGFHFFITEEEARCY